MKSYIPEEVLLDPEMRNSEVLDFERRLLSKIVGQDRAVGCIVNMYQIYLAGLATPNRPIGNLLFLGPTGSGKTCLVEASAEILFGSPRAFVKIDCAEFQHSHEIAKLIGSPPGYLGHRETPPLLTQEAIDQYQTERARFSFILFDEIEKANEALWMLLLGILDKATLTLGDNRKVDLSRCIIFMTSNLGAVEMNEMLSGGIGFISGIKMDESNLASIDQKIYHTALDVAKRRFSPEFMNRIDKVVVFRTLTRQHLWQILDIELNDVQNRIMASQSDKQFIFRCTPEAKEFLLKEGTDLQYGARHLKRAIERQLVYPISNLIGTGQIGLGNVIKVGLHANGEKLNFSKECGTPGYTVPDTEVTHFPNRRASQAGTGLQMVESYSSTIPVIRNKKFSWVGGDHDTFEVDNRLELNGKKVGSLLKVRKLSGIEKADTAYKLEIIGFLNDSRIVIQIDGRYCYCVTHQGFDEYFKII